MFILYALVLALVVGLATGGRLMALADLRLRWAPLILVGFLSQIVLFSDAVAARVGDAGPVLYVVSTLCVGVAVVRNLSLPGLPLIVLGAVSNMAAILANGGYMPATADALGSLGKTAPTIYSNSAVVAAPALAPLIDRFALPRWLPFANVFSIGDVLLAIGIFVLVVTAMRRSPSEAVRAAADLPAGSAESPQSAWIAAGADRQLRLSPHPTRTPVLCRREDEPANVTSEDECSSVGPSPRANPSRGGDAKPGISTY